MKIRAKAKTSNTPYPVWVQGGYLTEPPVRPSDGLKRPTGCYIDTGGYPGANVFEINIETFCMDTGAVDRCGCRIFENDILLYETGQEISYIIVQDTETAVDIISGEIIRINNLQTEDIKITGNIIDFPDFIGGMAYCVDAGIGIPYLPVLDTQETPYPYFKLTCLKCGRSFLSCTYMARHRNCGGHLAADFATKVHKKTKKHKESHKNRA